ncbi:ROK family protein [Halalkalibacter kiskunsagensis]|uniref:fructokinase n=1 Tax=Halalkalibacter kiskunsagensis TaxID=1548599 RepID=A0ABV6K8Q9_9BACI
MLYGGIEAGGTKFVCAVGDESGNIVKRDQFPTTLPEETMQYVFEFFKDFELKSLGVGSFGPIDINPNSLTYGSITSTPKKGWKDYPFLKTLKASYDIPLAFNTDVNAAALAEATFGAAKGFDSCLYITVGTGIGAGAVVQGNVLQGMSHPEMGHIIVRRHEQDTYEGSCLYHKDCLEGLAAGPAIKERWGKAGVDLADNKDVWEMEGFYLAQALMQYILILSPNKIILGGGVMKQKQVFPYVFEYVKLLLNDYVPFPEVSTNIEEYIVSPGLGDNAGIMGSILMGKQAYQEQL